MTVRSAAQTLCRLRVARFSEMTCVSRETLDLGVPCCVSLKALVRNWCFKTIDKGYISLFHVKQTSSVQFHRLLRVFWVYFGRELDFEWVKNVSRETYAFS